MRGLDIAAVFVLAGVLVSPATAKGIDAGAPKDAERTAGADQARGSYNVPVAPFGTAVSATRVVEGHVRWRAYRVADEPGTAAVIEQYRKRLADKGFAIVLDCAGAACGGFDFRFGADLLPPPAMRLDVRDFAQLTMERPNPPGLASVLVSSVAGAVYVQTVTVVPAVGSQPVAEAPVQRSVVEPDAERGLLEVLREEGHVQLNGVVFGSGGARLSTGSGAVLDRLAELLKGAADVSVAIVGHSDNQGGLEPNIALSQRRAEAVLDALVKRGIARERLEARGIGYLAPVASNATPGGRALNRRVELVLR